MYSYHRIHPTGNVYTFSSLLAAAFLLLWNTASFAQTPWSGIPTMGGQYLYCIDAVGANTIYTGGTNGALYKSTNKGATWSELSTGTQHWIVGLDFLDENEGWAAYINGMVGSSEIRHTTDGGKTWTPLLSDEGVEFGEIAFLNKQMGWVCTRTTSYYATTDGGKSWQKHELKMLREMDWTVKIQFLDAEHGWLSTLMGQLLYTTDGGTTWTASPVAGIEDFYFVDNQVGWVLYNGTVRKTVDGGKSWASISLPYAFKLNHIQFKNHDEGWILGGVDCSKGSCTSTPVLMHSTDGGATWTDETHPFPEKPMAYYDLAFSNEGMLYVSGYGGRVVAYEHSTVSVQETPPSHSILSPNPCAVGHTIAIDDNANIYGYAIYDMMGKQVQMKMLGYEPIRTMNTHALQKGTYSIQLYDHTQQVRHTSLLFLY